MASTCGPQPLGCLVQYSDDGLGFTVQLPSGWEIARSQRLQGIAGSRGAVEFRSGLYLGGAQALGSYWVSVGVWEARFGTLTETVEYDLSRIVLPEVRNSIKQHCCFVVGGEPAMELTGFPFERWGSRKLLVFHNGLQYSLGFRPYAMEFDSPSDLAAQEGFDLFLRTFTFIPVTPYPLVPWSPVPTPPQ